MIVGTFTGPSKLELKRMPRSKLKTLKRSKSKRSKSKTKGKVNPDHPPFDAETKKNKTVKGNDRQSWTSLQNSNKTWVWIQGSKRQAQKVLDCPHGMWVRGPTPDAPWRYLCDNEKPPAYLKRRSKSKAKKSRSASPARRVKINRKAYTRSDGTFVRATTYYKTN